MGNVKRLVQLPLLRVERWQIVDCQNSQDTASFGQNSVITFSCVVRGLKIALSLTLTRMQVHHAGVQIGLRRTHSPDQQREVLVDMRDGQGLTVQRPPPHCHHVRDRIHQATLVESEQLLDCVVDLDVCNLHVRKWRCKFLQMVLQYRQLCLSCRFAKSVFSILKFCLYIVCIELTYFKKLPVCI